MSSEAVDFLLVAGARPNFVKLAPLYHALTRTPSYRLAVVHTGQHYDHAMSGAFFSDLGLPCPDVNLEVGSGSHAQQTALTMMRFESVVVRQKPRWILVFGDVNSTIACALVGAKLGVRIAHVEAGLRSFDWTMPEEINRVLTDRISDRLYAPSEDAVDNLRNEGVEETRIVLVGNIMVDSLRARLPHVDQQSILSRHGVRPQDYLLVTLHRPSNVDEAATLSGLCLVLQQAAEHEPVLFPMHPRTRARLQHSGLLTHLGKVRILAPLPYPDFLGLTANARVVLTDSGGVQEETTALGVPCLTLRRNTERPITLTQGTNRLVGTDPATVMAAIQDAQIQRGRIPSLWDGCTAERIAHDLVNLTPPS